MAPVNVCRLLCLLSLVIYLPCTVAATNTSQRLLLILMDGFRYDYLNQTNLPLPGFDKLATNGVKVGGLVPDFPSLSFPNYYTLMTGLHTESHGMTGNDMYDVTRQEAFLIGTNPEYSHGHWWNHAEPLWISAVRENKTCHMWYWPGCEVEIRGLRPTFCQSYTGVPSMEDFASALNDSLSLLRARHTDMAAIYFELTDKYGHGYKPFSIQLNQVISDLDLIISDLVDQLSDPELAEVNLMIFSDHGMTEVKSEHVIDISGEENLSWPVLQHGPVVNVYVPSDKEQQVYDKLVNFHPNLTVYKKSDLPERWHYKNGPYVAPLTAVADLGWNIMIAHYQSVPMGNHGYDNKYSDMQGIFVGMGPAFKAGQTVERLRSVDLYQIMCHILGVRPSPHNGTPSDVTPLLADVTLLPL